MKKKKDKSKSRIHDNFQYFIKEIKEMKPYETIIIDESIGKTRMGMSTNAMNMAKYLEKKGGD